jgi:hypothetical protein
MIIYILYKNPIQLDTLYIVQYLYYMGVNLIPKNCIERNHPNWVSEFPSIETSNGDKYIGLESCIAFYEKHSGMTNLYNKSKEFKEFNPKYCIR